MTIDGRSLLAVTAALCLVFGLIVLALERRLRQPMPGLRLWAVSNLLLGLAAGAHALQGIAPLWVPASSATARCCSDAPAASPRCASSTAAACRRACWPRCARC